MRNESLMKVVRTLVEFQKAFFLQGPKKIVPLTLRNIAEEIGVHEGTVSRLTNGKYAQTDWGLFELKYFFSGSIAGTSGQQFTRESVKLILKDILAEHGGATLSDQKLCTLLEARGVKIARRTVAKYRSELDIASSYER
jgi:RNA polymerase sigma-54 factor